MTIGFEQTVYTVREDVGVVEVCAVQMRGVLERPAFVTLITTDNTATGLLSYCVCPFPMKIFRSIDSS